MHPAGGGGGGGKDRSSSSSSSSSSNGNNDKTLGLEWQDLCCKARGTERGGQGREILKRVSGRARPGRCVLVCFWVGWIRWVDVV
jgi:hypothetical protein